MDQYFDYVTRHPWYSSAAIFFGAGFALASYCYHFYRSLPRIMFPPATDQMQSDIVPVIIISPNILFGSLMTSFPFVSFLNLMIRLMNMQRSQNFSRLQVTTTA